MPDRPLVECVGLEGPLADLVADRALAALAALDLEADLDRLVVCADDLAGGDGAWYGPLDGRGRGAERGVTLYCHPGVFLAARPEADPPGPPSAVWERRPAAPAPPPAAADFARSRADVFLHHHLLTIRDLLRRELVPSQVPEPLAEAFAAAWAIHVDGRLARAGLPGRDPGESRRRFSRLFSAAGILMPEHWQIFQSLWDGLAGQPREVVRLVRRLPRL